MIRLAGHEVYPLHGTVRRSNGAAARKHHEAEPFHGPVISVCGAAESFYGPVNSIYHAVFGTYWVARRVFRAG